MNIQNTIANIQSFLEGRNDELKYLVNVEVDNDSRYATCYIQEPNKTKVKQRIEFDPFIYMKDLKKTGHVLFGGDKEKYKIILKKYGITIKKMKTGNHPRLENGYPYKISTTKTYTHIMNFLSEAGINPWEKRYDEYDKPMTDRKGRPIFKFRELFYIPKLNEQFFISTGIRLFKGFEEYDDLHKLTFDIETTGLRWEHERIFAIGLKDNRGYKKVLEVDKFDDDRAEKRLIKDFFKEIVKVSPAVILGYNSENFDFEFILERAKMVDLNLKEIQTTLSREVDIIKGKKNKATVKFGNTTEKYNATVIYGMSVLDIIHAVKKTIAVNTEIKNAKLKYICQFEGIAKPNRTYIDGSGGNIYRYYQQNPMFIINRENNNYIEIPKNFKDTAKKLFVLNQNKSTLSKEEYVKMRNHILSSDKEFVIWIKENGKDLGKYEFEEGKKILESYLLDDLWETEQVDNLYNQSSFLLAKIVPTVYSRVSTMGNAAVWNLLMTAWSYENDLAIPHPDGIERFVGGLSRCYRTGYAKRVVKIDYASLYPMIQLTHDVFPLFDITGVIKKMLSYLTTTRNIYKKLASSSKLNDSEISLLETIDHETYLKFINNTLTKEERKMFKVKQLPIKILNNSLFGALGSGFAFNWSDNICAARITSTGRLYLRMAMDFFKKYGLIPLLAVTDGVNFSIPETTKFKLTNDGISEGMSEGIVEEMWEYGDLKGVDALIEYFNDQYMPKPYMAVDNDGEFDSCLNLARINYALKKGDKIKLTGNNIKSKVMPDYIEEFIDEGFKFVLNGDGEGFVNYYYDYAEKIFYEQVPLKQIAKKSKVKNSIADYEARGVDKNGKKKSRQAHMELLIRHREEIAQKLFEEKFEDLERDSDKPIEDYSIGEIMSLVETYMPPEPEIGTTLYYVNTGERKSHGDVKTKKITDDEGNEDEEVEINATLLNEKEMEKNPNLKGKYNVDKYLDAFNKRVEILIIGFEEEVRNKLLVKIKRTKNKDANGNKVEIKSLEKTEFTPDQLTLQNFKDDDFEESLVLENKEIDFWNSYGYNPKRVWDGFGIKDDAEHGLLHNDIYEYAIDFLSEKMIQSGKPKLKSVDDKLEKGDYVLIKTNKKDNEGEYSDKYYIRNDYKEPEYMIGYHNGTFVEVIKTDVKVPKSEKEERWVEETKIAREKLNIEKYDGDEEIRKKIEEIERDKKEKDFYWIKFSKKVFNNSSYEMDFIFNKLPNVKKAFFEFIQEQKSENVPDEIYEPD